MGWMHAAGTRMPPIVELHSIDDVPFLTLTLWSTGWTSDRLRPAGRRAGAGALRDPGATSRAQLIGGQPRVVRVEPDPDRMAAAGVSWTQLTGVAPGGLRPAGGRHGGARQPRDPRRGGAALPERRTRSAGWSWASRGGRPVYVSDVARVVDGPDEATDAVFFSPGPAGRPRRPGGPRAPGGHDRPRQAHRAPTRRALADARPGEGRGPAAAAAPRRRPRRGHAQLRRDGARRSRTSWSSTC